MNDRHDTGTYAVQCICTNCGHYGTLGVKRGDLAPGAGIGSKPAECPYCGCRTYVRRGI